jgi:cytochrome P450
MNRIGRRRLEGWGEREEVDVYEEARLIAFDAAAECLAGMRAESVEADRFRETYREMFGLAAEGATSSGDEAGAPEQAAVGVVDAGPRALLRLWVLRRRLRALVLAAVRRRRRGPGADPVAAEDVLGLLCAARGPDGGPLSDGAVAGHLGVLLAAGHETTTSLAAWLLWLLAGHPEYLGRVLAEQEAVFWGRCPQAEPTAADLAAMPALERALDEAGRLYPLVGNAPRGVTREVRLGGQVVPAGCFAFLSIGGGHRLGGVWEEPHAFDPDRLAPPRSEQRRTPYALATFGGGPRRCPGSNFARQEILSLASQVVRRYRMEAVPGQRVAQFYRGPGVPVEGIRMRFADREMTARGGGGPR